MIIDSNKLNIEKCNRNVTILEKMRGIASSGDLPFPRYELGNQFLIKKKVQNPFFGLSRVFFSSAGAEIDIKPHHCAQVTLSTPAPSLVLTQGLYHRRLHQDLLGAIGQFFGCDHRRLFFPPFTLCLRKKIFECFEYLNKS